MKGLSLLHCFRLDPGSGNVVGTVLNCDKNQAEVAIEAAQKAFPAWSRMNPTVLYCIVCDT